MTKKIIMATKSICFLGILLSWFLSAAFAQSNKQAGQKIITSQLEAFLSNDFERAYSYASDDIKKIYPNINGFMAMVKNGYLPVLRPGNYAFGDYEELSGVQTRQDVLIRAPDGSDWTATYFMELQADGSWKVDGVQLFKGAAGMI